MRRKRVRRRPARLRPPSPQGPLLAVAAVLALGCGMALLQPAETRQKPVFSYSHRLILEPLPPGEAVSWVSVQRGDTLRDLWEHQRIPTQHFHMLTSLPDADVLNHLREGDLLQFTLRPDGELASLHLKREGYEVVFTRGLGGFSTFNRRLEIAQRLRYAVVRITGSLQADARQANLHPDLVEELGRLLNWGIDVAGDIGHGDRLRLVYEEEMVESRPTGRFGHILYAEHLPIAGGRPYAIVRHVRGGEAGYYSPSGANIRKAFLRTPVKNFLRISSGYNLNRRHPILHTVRAHKGVDYAAPLGSEVMAAGDGEVTFAGQARGYGSLIIIRHPGGYLTYYAHLNHFAPGITRKSAVKQGQTIAYVGQTGGSTGPHLHYEFRTGEKSDDHVDPVVVELPNAPPLRGADAVTVRVRARQMAHWLDMFEELDHAQVCHGFGAGGGGAC